MRDSRLAVSQTDRGKNTVSAVLQIDSTRIKVRIEGGTKVYRPTIVRNPAPRLPVPEVKS